MPVKIKTLKDSLITEVIIELPTDIAALEQLLKTTKAPGKIVATYNQGGVLGVVVEQRTRVPEAVAQQIRDLLGIETKNL